MTERWAQRLARVIYDGEPSAALHEELDRVLLWLNHPRHPRVSALTAACADLGLTSDAAARRVYTALDRLLFSADGSPYRVLALPVTANAAQIKRRYRRLIQSYHPDRHPQNADLSRHYTERIIAAYQCLRQPLNLQHPPRRPPRPRRGYAAYQPLPPPPVSALLRQSLGRSAALRIWIFVVLLVVCTSVLAMLYHADRSMRWPTPATSTEAAAAIMPARSPSAFSPQAAPAPGDAARPASHPAPARTEPDSQVPVHIPECHKPGY